MRILLAEDTEDVAWPIRLHFSRDGHAMDHCATLTKTRDALAVQAYDLIILDINLPDGSGFDLLKDLRRSGNATPVLVLTARLAVEDRVSALDMGADDYLVKPFDVRELAARARVLLRRGSADHASGVSTLGNLCYDPAAQRVTVAGVELKLTRREMSLLGIFLTHPNRALSKEEIHAKLFGFDDDSGLNAVELYVGRLRRKLAGSQLAIETRWGVGYQVIVNG